MSDWQPIETAPKYGDILVYCADTDEQFVVFRRKRAWIYAHVIDGKIRITVACEPTHWRPLPEPPVDREFGPE